MKISRISCARSRVVAAALMAGLCLSAVNNGASAAAGATAENTSPKVTIAHPVEAGCRRALRRIGVQFMSAGGANGGCSCLAESFDEQIATDLHRPALEAFVLAVLARHTQDNKRQAVFERFNALKTRHQLEQNTYSAMIGKMAHIINTCG